MPQRPPRGHGRLLAGERRRACPSVPLRPPCTGGKPCTGNDNRIPSRDLLHLAAAAIRAGVAGLCPRSTWAMRFLLHGTRNASSA
ncbi:MAG: hypothetical protein ACRDNT_02775 [Streptosporangiaceae bacterium]